MKRMQTDERREKCHLRVPTHSSTYTNSKIMTMEAKAGRKRLLVWHFDKKAKRLSRDKIDKQSMNVMKMISVNVTTDTHICEAMCCFQDAKEQHLSLSLSPFLFYFYTRFNWINKTGRCSPGTELRSATQHDKKMRVNTIFIRFIWALVNIRFQCIF